MLDRSAERLLVERYGCRSVIDPQLRFGCRPVPGSRAQYEG